MTEKPPLDEYLLAHFGIKGMKWGKRKVRPDEQKRKDTFSPAAKAERIRRIRNGALVVGGAVAVGLLLSKRGRTAITNNAVTNYAQQRSANNQASANPFSNLAQKFRDVNAASVPSPNEMVANARMAGVRNAVNREGAQRLTDRAWRDQARLSNLTRDMDATTNSLLSGNAQRLADAARQRLG